MLEIDFINQNYLLLQLFNYDPDQDQTGDHFICWATFTSFGINTTVGEAVKEAVNFQTDGMLSFNANI